MARKHIQAGVDGPLNLFKHILYVKSNVQVSFKSSSTNVSVSIRINLATKKNYSIAWYCVAHLFLTLISQSIIASALQFLNYVLILLLVRL